MSNREIRTAQDLLAMEREGDALVPCPPIYGTCNPTLPYAAQVGD